MKDTSSAAKVKTKEHSVGHNTTNTRGQEAAPANLEMSKYGIISILAVGGVAGLFGMLFLIGGLLSAGSPLKFVSEWVTAAFGL